MTDDDLLLLRHYLEVGGEPWNGSTEAAWYELAMRTWVEDQLPTMRPLRVCNVGIGVGTWDDWLAHAIGGPITSVDRDRGCCELLELRQRREQHPFPSEVLCGDVRDRVLGDRTFDVITVVGSTLRENGVNREDVERAIAGHLAPGGVLLIAEALTAEDRVPHGAELQRFRDCVLACRVRCQGRAPART